ncbi:hypothetical protein L3Y34_005338 [Caenorhabditis briggsae]|uniref:Fibrinogen C-terminal domain-containing protein n=1 Tax=Caenorhabditis briggsae TaxID=6238 RepID=A0AAE9D648_CAEBR|nr:hypothetical protein L3Y34_005338 [Caenorhabditis briggsae]
MSSRLTDKQIIGYCRLGYAPFFQGFNVSLKLTTSDGSIIDQYNFHVDSTDSQGIYAYTSLRPGTISTTISITWSTNKKNIPAPNPKTTTPAGTGSTPTQSPTTTAPKLPADCDEVEDKTSGIQIIYPDGINPISVYCDQTTEKAYTSTNFGTVVFFLDFRRGTLKNISFDLPYANYSDWFGESGIGKNFWMGLDLMNAMSNNKTYNLQIDLCCGRQLRAKQIFHGFTVGCWCFLNQNVTNSSTTMIIMLDHQDMAAGGLEVVEKIRSCGNKNGFLYPSASGDCSVKNFDSTLLLGINMRTTSQTAKILIYLSFNYEL